MWLWCILAPCAALCAENQTASPEVLSVTFTLKLLDFVEGFSPQTETHFDLCTYGLNAEESSAFAYLTGQKITSTPWQLKEVTAVSNNSNCDALYIGGQGDTKLLPDLRASANNAFTVSGKTVAEASRAMVVLYFERDRLNFDVYLQHLNEGNFKLSSRVLKLANRIIEGRK